MFLYAVRLKGRKVEVEKTSCRINNGICESFKVSIPVSEMGMPVIGESFEVFTNDEKKVPILKKNIVLFSKEIKKQRKLLGKSEFVEMSKEF